MRLQGGGTDTLGATWGAGIFAARHALKEKACEARGPSLLAKASLKAGFHAKPRLCVALDQARLLRNGEAEVIACEPQPTEVDQRDSLTVRSPWFFRVRVEKVRTQRVNTFDQACVRWILFQVRGDDRFHRAVVKTVCVCGLRGRGWRASACAMRGPRQWRPRAWRGRP